MNNGNGFYIDVVSKSIISGLSDEIGRNITEQINEFIKEFLNNEFSGLIAEKIKTETDRLGQALSETEKKTRASVENSNKDIKEYIEDNIGKILKKEDGQKAVLSDEIADMKETLSTAKKEQDKLLKGVIENELVGLKDKLEISLENMKEDITVSGSDTRSAITKNISDMRSYFEEQIGRTHEREKSSILKIVEQLLDGLSVVKKDISKSMEKLINEKEQNGQLEGVIEKQFSGLREKLESSINTIKEDMTERGGETRSLVTKSNDEMKSYFEENIKSFLQRENDSSGKISEEMLDGIADFKRDIERSLSELIEEKGQTTGLDDELYEMKQIVSKTRKEQNEMLKGIIENQLISLTKRVGSTIEGIQQGMSGIEDKTKQLVMHSNKEIKMYIEDYVGKNKNDKNTSEEITAQLLESLQDMKKEIEQKLDKQSKKGADSDLVYEVKEAVNKGDKEQIEMLKGVFYSVKRLTTAAKKDQEVADNMAAEFRSSLDVLYGHINRLENERDELGVELMRLAGDEYLKTRFTEMEDELDKARNAAEGYQQENKELQEKLKKFQSLWEKSKEKKKSRRVS